MGHNILCREAHRLWICAALRIRMAALNNPSPYNGVSQWRGAPFVLGAAPAAAALMRKQPSLQL
jgi:hypothetical protein